MNRSKLIYLFTFLLISLQVAAQFSIDGEFRTRSILNHGFKVPVKASTDAVFSVDQRSRLNLNYKNDWYTARLILQDARIWGSDDIYNPTGTLGNSAAFGIYEAWVELKLKEKSSLRIGRQQWNYNKMRILSFRNWWTTGLSYDGLLYKMYDPQNGWFIDMGLSYNNDGVQTGEATNSTWTGEKLKTLNFVNLKKNLNDKLSLTAFFSLSGRDYPEIDQFFATGTHGLIMDYNQSGSGVFGFLSGYYQHGTDKIKRPDGDYRNISAYLLTGELGYRAPSKKWELAAGAELISGNSNTESDYLNTKRSFDLLYSARFPYYGGNLTHFVVQDSYKTGTRGGGYFDPFLRFSFKPGKKNSLAVTWWSPFLTTEILAHTSIDPASGKPSGIETDGNGENVYWKGNLGNYIDFNFTQRVNPDVVLKTGLSFGGVSDIKNQMVYGYKNPAQKELFELGTNYMGWIMLIVKPNFFASE